MIGRAQRTSLPSLPSQNIPIDFPSATSSKDAAHARAKLDHDRSKLSLASLSPGQAVHLQDSKSSAWDKQGIIVSVRPDRLSYIIKVENRFFTRPQRLLRPVTPDTPFSVPSSTPPSSSHPGLRRSFRLRSKVNTAVQRTPSSPHPSPSTSTLALTWLPSSFNTARMLSTRSANNRWSRSILQTEGAQPLPPQLSTWKMTPASQSTTASPTSPVTSTWTNPIMDFPSSTYTGRRSAPVCLPSSPLSWRDYSSLA